MAYTGNIVQIHVETVYKTLLVTIVTEPVRMDVMLDIKEITAQQLVAMANLEETVYTNAVRIVGTVKYVTKRTDIVPPVFLGLKDLNVMKNAKTGVLERDVPNSVAAAYMVVLVIT